MTHIGIISDTHGYLHPDVFHHFKDCDEIWHAGDFGEGVADQLAAFKPLRGVYGNIDSQSIRRSYPEQIVFECEKVKVMMRHIGGYPPRYNQETKIQLDIHRPMLFVDGHSHILKVMYDKVRSCLHINPGAAGRHGWQKVKTVITLDINEDDMKNLKVIELPQ